MNVNIPASSGISTHTLTWSVTAVIQTVGENIRISTHTLTWSVTQDLVKTEDEPTISTHTLTWSVTKDFLRYAIGKIISTHTLTWSVTIAGVKLINALYDFNSHAHVERDRLNFLTMKCIYQISTHTLTWSVTLKCFPILQISSVFQLTRSRGA